MKITHAQSQIVRLFEEVPQPVKGELAVPDKPGLGLKFDRDALKQYSTWEKMQPQINPVPMIFPAPED